MAPPEVSGSGCTTFTPGRARSAKSRIRSGFPLRTTSTNGVRLTTPPWGSRRQEPAGRTPALASRSASSSNERRATWAGTPMMSWLVIVPEPAKEVTNSSRSPVRARQRRANSGSTARFIASPRMLKP